jgi:hypothetical protein
MKIQNVSDRFKNFGDWKRILRKRWIKQRLKELGQ